MSTQTFSPEIRIASCNVKGAFSDAERGQAILNWLGIEQPTVAFFAEAYPADRPGDLETVLDGFRERLGEHYEVRHIPQELTNEQATKRPDAHGIVMVAKRDQMRWRQISIVNLAGRRALLAEMHDPVSKMDYDVFGHHGNDDKNEQLRLDDIVALGEHIPRTDTGDFLIPTVVATAANTMQYRGFWPRVLYAAQRVVDRLESAPPDPNDPPTGLKRVASVAQRLAAMASGTAYRFYQHFGFRNADRAMKPTMRKYGVISVKTDHIFVSPEFAVGTHKRPRLAAIKDRVSRAVPLSHRAIAATMRLRVPR